MLRKLFKNILRRISGWFKKTKLENEIEKAIQEKGIPKYIICHPSVLGEVRETRENFIGGIKVFENEFIAKDKVILSWIDEPFGLELSDTIQVSKEFKGKEMIDNFITRPTYTRTVIGGLVY